MIHSNREGCGVGQGWRAESGRLLVIILTCAVMLANCRGSYQKITPFSDEHIEQWMRSARNAGSAEEALGWCSKVLRISMAHREARVLRAMAWAQVPVWQEAQADIVYLVVHDSLFCHQAFASSCGLIQDSSAVQGLAASLVRRVYVQEPVPRWIVLRKSLEAESGTFAGVGDHRVDSILGRTELACSTQIALWPGSAQGYLCRGQELYVQRAFEAALAQFSHALSRDPGLREGYVWMAKSCGALGRYRKGVMLVNKAIALDPVEPGSYAVRAYLYHGLDKRKQERADLSKALALGYANKEFLRYRIKALGDDE